VTPQSDPEAGDPISNAPTDDRRGGIEVIDCHVHVGLAKYGPVEPYLAAMAEHGLRRAVLVQYIGNHDNAYLEDCLRRYPGRFAAIGAVDVTRPDAPDFLRALAEGGAFRGIRLAAGTRSPGRDPLAIWRCIDQLGLIASVSGPHSDFLGDDFAGIVDAFPDAHFRLEHLGWLRLDHDPMLTSGFGRFLRLADRPNTSVTWSGFFLSSAEPYPFDDTQPFLRDSFAAFGARRIMWSGDWNRAGLGPTDYQAAIDLIFDHAPFLSDEDRAWIMGRTAATLFQLDGLG
jgi:L-fuconolactonase